MKTIDEQDRQLSVAAVRGRIEAARGQVQAVVDEATSSLSNLQWDIEQAFDELLEALEEE